MKTQLLDILKKNIGILVIGGLFLFFYFKGCGNNGQGTVTHDTVTHTIQVQQPIIITQPYVPQQAGSTVYIPLPPNAQGTVPASTIEGLVAQVKDLSTRIEALGREYYAVKHYEDSIQLKDTSGKRVGVVNLKQIVSENTLKSTQPSYQLSFPHTITVIDNTVHEKLRNQVYAGLGWNESINENIYGVEVSLLLKNKKNNIFRMGAGTTLDGSPTYSVGYYKLISFRKHK